MPHAAQPRRLAGLEVRARGTQERHRVDPGEEPSARVGILRVERWQRIPEGCEPALDQFEAADQALEPLGRECRAGEPDPDPQVAPLARERLGAGELLGPVDRRRLGAAVDRSGELAQPREIVLVAELGAQGRAARQRPDEILELEGHAHAPDTFSPARPAFYACDRPPQVTRITGRTRLSGRCAPPPGG